MILMIRYPNIFYYVLCPLSYERPAGYAWTSGYHEKGGKPFSIADQASESQI
jgi:hypothetical protein